jgi:hypothetical protein
MNSTMIQRLVEDNAAESVVLEIIKANEEKMSMGDVCNVYEGHLPKRALKRAIWNLVDKGTFRFNESYEIEFRT